jgi:hypothetical protein
VVELVLAQCHVQVVYQAQERDQVAALPVQERVQAVELLQEQAHDLAELVLAVVSVRGLHRVNSIIS